MHSDIYELINLKLDLTIDATQIYILILVIKTLTFIQDHGAARNKKFWTNYFTKYWINLNWILLMLRPAGVMNLISTLSCPIDIQGRELCICEFAQNTC